MHASIELPEPGVDALAHSERVAALIRHRIDAAGGWLDFSDYMELALYAPGLGYYSAGSTKFGAAGDFVTAPEVSGLFARCIARAIAPVIRRAAGHSLLEFGAGTGALAAELLLALDRLGAAPDRYRILEVSADLRDRQQRTLAERAPGQMPRVEWLDELPSPFEGVVIANEVLDALPLSRFRVAVDGVRALGVVAADGGFGWAERPAGASLRGAVAALEATIGKRFPPGFAGEIRPGLPAFLAGCSSALRDGICLLIDYGLPRRELYVADRPDGTLICHYRHRAHADPFRYPGLQDISAWVDFTAAAEAAAAADLRVDGYTTQAAFLLAAGIEHEFNAAMAADTGDQARVRLSREMQTLLMPGQMGEKFKVMTLGRGVAALGGKFAERDQRHRL